MLFAVGRLPRPTGPAHYFWVELPDRGHDGREGAAPPHLARDLADRARRRRARHAPPRQRPSSGRWRELEVGDEVEVEEPKGSFLLPEDTSIAYVFVAGGIGITVFRSMLRYIADEELPYDVTLVYSNRDRESSRVPRRAARSCESAASTGLRVVLTMTDERGLGGRDAAGSTRTLLRDARSATSTRDTFIDRRPARPMVDGGRRRRCMAAGVPRGPGAAGSFSGY